MMNDFPRAVRAHVKLLPSGREFDVEGNDSILEGALRAGVALNYGCSTGNCGLCKARIVAGQTARIRHHDYRLSEAEKSAGYVLLCAHAPLSDLTIEALEASQPTDIPRQHIPARVKSVTPLTDKVMLLQLQTPRSNRLRFLAGQRARLSSGDAAADYPIASCPCDGHHLEFHIRDLLGDAFARRIFGGLKSGDTVVVDGPSGEFVLNEASSRPILFIACNSGFAQITSLIQHAMSLEKAAAMHLYWLATYPPGGHYQANLCRSWADALDNFHYTELLVAALETSAVREVLEEIARDYPDISRFDAYLAGPESFLVAAWEWLLEHKMPVEQIAATLA